MRAESVLKLLEFKELYRDKNCLSANGTEGAVSVFHLSKALQSESMQAFSAGQFSLV